MAFAALVFDFDVVGIEEIPGLAKLDHVAGDVDETGEADAAILGREADEDTEGIGIGDGQDPHAHGGVVDEKRIGLVGDPVGGNGEGHGLSVPSPVAGEPGKGIESMQDTGRSGGVGRQLLRECPVFLVQGPR